MAGVCRQRSLTHRRIPQPFVCPLEKGLQPDIRAQDDSRLAGCAHAFSAECTRGDDDEVVEEEEGEGGGDIRTRIQEWNV